MKERKMIQRYCLSYESTSIPAGVYAGSRTIDITVKTFPVVINYFSLQSFMYDSVTDQMIEGIASISTNIGLSDNPGLITTDPQSPNMVARNGNVIQLPYHFELAAETTFRLTPIFRLMSVTANAILAACYFQVGYLCPEDYLSFDMMLISPK